MATNKHATIRYIALDKCFRNVGRNYSINDLVEECNKAIYNFTGINEGVKKRQVYNDITFMKSNEGWSIDLKKYKVGRIAYYRYANTDFSINKVGLNESEAHKLKEVLLTLGKFSGMPQFEWINEMSTRLESSFNLVKSDKTIIEFEQNPYLIGNEFVNSLFHSIVYKKVLKMYYKGFNKPDIKEFIFHPHFLKQYNNRWFVFGVTDGYNNISTYALDRIMKFEELKNQYIESNTNYKEYFEDVVGVTIHDNNNTSKILIKADSNIAPYINSKPLHGSQKIKSKEETYWEFEIEVIINYELKSLLYSFGNSIEVLSPEHLRNSFLANSQALLEKYF